MSTRPPPPKKALKRPAEDRQMLPQTKKQKNDLPEPHPQQYNEAPQNSSSLTSSLSTLTTSSPAIAPSQIPSRRPRARPKPSSRNQTLAWTTAEIDLVIALRIHAGYGYDAIAEVLDERYPAPENGSKKTEHAVRQKLARLSGLVPPSLAGEGRRAHVIDPRWIHLAQLPVRSLTIQGILRPAGIINTPDWPTQHRDDCLMVLFIYTALMNDEIAEKMEQLFPAEKKGLFAREGEGDAWTSQRVAQKWADLGEDESVWQYWERKSRRDKEVIEILQEIE